jgi:hypothetical protein
MEYNEDKMEEEMERLHEADAWVIIEYIKTSVDILLNIRQDKNANPIPNKVLTSTFYEESYMNNSKCTDALVNVGEMSWNFSGISGADGKTQKKNSFTKEDPKEYEEQLQKMEADVRMHIGVSNFEILCAY